MEEKPGEEGDFGQAIQQFTEAITLNRNNFQLFSQRSAAYARIGRFREALDDAKRCHELKPDWPKGLYRLGVAYQGLAQYEEALISFAGSLAADPKQSSTLIGLADAMLKSPMKGNFAVKLEKFESLKLDKNPFIVTAAVGQELLLANKLDTAVKILECARAIGTDRPKLEALLLQALGRAYWMMKNTEKALSYMEQDLKLNESLSEALGCIHAHDDLGIAYASMEKYEETVQHHTEQFKLAKANGMLEEMILALNRLGAIFMKISSYAQAQGIYKDALKLARELNDLGQISEAFYNLALTNLAAGDVDRAVRLFHEELQLAKDSKNKEREAEAYSHLGHSCYLKGNYDQSMMFFQQLLSVAVQTNDMAVKAQAYGGMGQANRAMNQLWHAQSCREQQLKIYQDIQDEEGQLVALTHIGHVHRAANKFSQAMQFYSKSLTLAQKLKDKAGEAKAYSSLGNCHMALDNVREAIGIYKQELEIVESTGDRAAQASTLGNLGKAFLQLDSQPQAHEYLEKSLRVADKLEDKYIICQSLCNLGNFYAKTKKYSEGLPSLDRALKLAQELREFGLERQVCHNLGICHEGLGNHQQAIQYFQHDFMVAKDAQDKAAMTEACEKLVKANMEIGDKEQADIYRRKLASIAEEIQSTSGRCTFWYQMAEEAMNEEDLEKAVEYYENLLKESKREQHQSFEGVAYKGLGNAHLSLQNYDHALSYYQHDLKIRKATNDLTGECEAYSNMGAVHNSLNQPEQALECFEHQLSLARQLENPVLVTKAYGCLGIVHRNIRSFQNALHYHQLQLNTALLLKENLLEQAGAYANLGDSYEAVSDYAQAARNHELHLQLAQKVQNDLLQMRALGSLGRAHRGLGALRKSLQYFEQRLALAKKISDVYIEAECYADIGNILMMLKDYSRASEAFRKQLEISRTIEDSFSEALAACGLGEVQYHMGNYREAIHHHTYDLEISSHNGYTDGEARALGNIADTYEGMRDYGAAITYREKQVSAAETLGDLETRAMAFMGLGKTFLRVGDFQQAVSLLKQALSLTVGPKRINGYDPSNPDVDIETEAKIRFYLGQAFYHLGQNDHAHNCLQKSLPLFEKLRQNVGNYDHPTKQTLELLPILYQTLICVLVKLNKVELALEMAERERNRALVDALLERDVNRQTMKECGLMKPFAPDNSWIQEAVNTITMPVLYYSIALRHVMIWLLHPKTGIVQFKKVEMFGMGMVNSDTASVFSESSATYTQPLTDCISALHEALGVDSHQRQGIKQLANLSSTLSDDSEDSESVLSVGGELGLSSSPTGGSSNRSPGKSSNMQHVYDLYDLLINPVDCALPSSKLTVTFRGQIIIIPDKHLYKVPFGMLRPDVKSDFLYQQFHLLFAPSLQSLIASKPTTRKKSSPSSAVSKRTAQSPSPRKQDGLNSVMSRIPKRFPDNRPKSPLPIRKLEDGVSGGKELKSPTAGALPMHLVVGNPLIPVGASQHGWQSMNGAEKEIKFVADLLETKPLIGASASKEQVLKKLPEAQSIYLATNISWRRSQIVLAVDEDTPPNSSGDADSGGGISLSLPRRIGGDGAAISRRGVADGSAEGSSPEPGKYLLSISDIMDSQLCAKIVVISGCHRSDSSRCSAESLMCMAEAFLASGAQCVLVPLWPSTHLGSRLMMNAFYSSLLYGSKVSRALSYAMQIVSQSSKHGHPSNWAGYMLLGKDIILRDRLLDLARSFRAMLQSQQDYLIAALKTLQAVIVASRKHLAQQREGRTEPKITTRSAIESKVGLVHGWEELLVCNGFHFMSQSKKDIPATVVFPEHDDSNIQKMTHKYIESLIGIPPPCLKALGTLSKHPTIARPLLSALRSACGVLTTSNLAEVVVEIQLEREVWQLAECPTFFQHLRFSLPSHTSNQVVVLQSPAKRLDAKAIHHAVTSVLAVFGPEEYMHMPAQKPAVIESELL